ncbi:MFS transporter [Nesterenkonia sp. LB17]|uniref:MFS transporter n=1 Tax=unclassified Nesterenkonia TaxID=2629769 RepID=UPI001F4D0C8E|nr:MFS transporter [Nesterenkonia sp. DZ6]MCH8562689.1 MFS transporter [Nesterenkonia sp. YGD6]MCH8565739.1 MFS transporter [Nesterenkonia sp. LB17]MCH8570531.1 MFS transporter [Nesterenkonia sp. AY15]
MIAAKKTAAAPKEPLFTKDFLLAIVINLFLAIVFFVLVTGLAVYAAEEFSAGETAAGFAASAFVVGALAARIFAGKYVNFLGRRRTVLACLVVYVLAGLAYLVVDSYEMLIALRAVHGISFGFGQTALNAGVFAMIPRTRRGEGAGYYLLANSLPPAIGPLAAIQLTQRYDFWAMFVAVTIVSVVALVFSLFLRLPEDKPWRTSLVEKLTLRPRDIIEPRAFKISLVAMLLGIGFASVMTFLNGYARSLDMVDAASIFFVIYAGAVLVSRLFMGKVQDRYGDNWAVYPAVICYIIAMGLLAWTPNQGVLLTAGVLAGFGFGSLLPVLQAIIASDLPAHRTSIGISTFFIMLDAGFGFSPLLLGPLVSYADYRFMYAMCAGVVVLSLVLYWLVHGRHDVHQGVARRIPGHGRKSDDDGVIPSPQGT